MKFQRTRVMNFEGAFRGLRNPLESWEKSDSVFGITNLDSMLDYDIASLYCEKDNISMEDFDNYDTYQSDYAEWLRKNGILKWDEFCQSFEYAYIGPKDLDLAHRMIKAGESDSKFLRQIFVSVDITAPLYWFKQLDTYKIATVANSTSTMHKLASTPITIDCFEIDDYQPNLIFEEGVDDYGDTPFDYKMSIDSVIGKDEEKFYRLETFIGFLESLRQKYNATKDKRYWKELIRWLPESWLQTRTFTCNYAVLRNMYFQRQHHKLSEWHQFCKWVETLPYSADLITYKG